MGLLPPGGEVVKATLEEHFQERGTDMSLGVMGQCKVPNHGDYHWAMSTVPKALK